MIYFISLQLCLFTWTKNALLLTVPKPLLQVQVQVHFRFQIKPEPAVRFQNQRSMGILNLLQKYAVVYLSADPPTRVTRYVQYLCTVHRTSKREENKAQQSKAIIPGDVFCTAPEYLEACLFFSRFPEQSQKQVSRGAKGVYAAPSICVANSPALFHLESNTIQQPTEIPVRETQEIEADAFCFNAS